MDKFTVPEGLGDDDWCKIKAVDIQKGLWTDQHYNHNYTLTEEEKEQGFIKLDVYKVA